MFPLIGIFYLLFIGLGWLLLLQKKLRCQLELSLFLSSSFLIGVMGSFLLLYLTGILGLSWNRLVILSITSLTAIIGYVTNFNSLKNYYKSYAHTRAISILIAFLCCLSLLIYQTNLRHELLHSDSLANWFLRGKIFFTDRGFNLNRLNHLPFTTLIDNPDPNQTYNLGFTSLQYPILLPVSISFNHLIYHQAAIIPAKYLWLAIEFCLGLTLWHISRTLFPKSQFSGLLGPILFYSIPATFTRFSIHQFGYADIWLATFSLAGLWHLWLWLQNKQQLHLLLGVIFITGSTMIKIEGLSLLYLVPLLAVSLNKQHKQLIVYCLPLILLPLSWYLYAAQIQSQSGMFTTALSVIRQGQFALDGFAEIIFTYFSQLVYLPVQGLTWILFFSTFMFRFIKKSFNSKIELFLQLVVLAGILFTLSNYFILPYYAERSLIIKQNIGRFSSQWYPTLIMFSLINLAPKPSSKSSRTRKS